LVDGWHDHWAMAERGENDGIDDFRRRCVTHDQWTDGNWSCVTHDQWTDGNSPRSRRVRRIVG
jgi:hypothetical protein